jgi:hypothetical protein
VSSDPAWCLEAGAFTLTLPGGLNRPDPGPGKVWGHTDYVLTLDRHDSSAWPGLPSRLVRRLSDTHGLLNFGNFLGQATLLGHTIEVITPKLDQAAFACMLNDLVRCWANLPFEFESPAGTVCADDFKRSPVPYHQWLLLRAWVEGDGFPVSLEDEITRILNRIHRQVKAERQVLPVEKMTRASAITVAGIAARPDRLAALPGGSRLHDTALGRVLGGRFPTLVEAERVVVSHDTPENRFVKHALDWMRQLNRAFQAVVEARAIQHPLLAAADRIDDLLTGWLAHPVFRDIGPFRGLPGQSMVLQRQEGYRGLHAGYLRLLSAARPPGEPEAWQRILQLKDAATLYELWTFRCVIDELASLLGPPHSAATIREAPLSVVLPHETRVSWRVDGTWIHACFNRTFNRDPHGSYSVSLRPDITVEANGRRCVLDAKFKLDGGGWGDELSEAEATREDLYKMHAYRDAIRGVESAWVLYPGEGTGQIYDREGSWIGVGTIPLKPGLPVPDLMRQVLSAFVAAN